MPLIQSIDSALEKNVGSHGIADAALKSALDRAEAALDWLRARYADGGLPLLRLAGKHDDLRPVIDAGRRLADRATDIVLLGTGGSSLGGQTLSQLAWHGVPGVGALRPTPHLHFMDNIDPRTYAALLDRLPHGTTRFVAISKSGGTAETLMQTIAALTMLKAQNLGPRIPDIFLGLTEPAKPGKRNGLRELLTHHHIPCLEHDTGVGGRFSALTNVGLLPAAMLGLDIVAIRSGAHEALKPVLDKKKAADVPAALGAALSVALAETKGKSISVVMPYADKLERFTRWYVQLWAESLGKDGKGTTPVAALGPVDQHSQVQLYLGGPRDKFFTVLSTDTKGVGPTMDAELSKLAGEAGFGGKTLGDLVDAEARATAETLAKNGCPVRTMHLPEINEATMGELLMHFMLETIIAANMMGIDAFDQPAVEEGKVLAKKYLTGN
jgi:glucose-6-phosphate isomerase